MMAKKTMSVAPVAISLLNEAVIVLNQHWTYPGMDTYAIQYLSLQLLFQKQWAGGNNTRTDVVYLKASTLNLYYSTNIVAMHPMAVGISRIHNIDQRLQSGDPTLVNDIATIIPRHNYSFATKYCACHNPIAYPIYDNIVADFFCEIIRKGHLHCFQTQKKMKEKMKADYSFYKAIYTAFMQQYNLTSLTYRDVDWYIWTAGKLLQNLLTTPAKNKHSINVWTTNKSVMPQLPQFARLFLLVL